MGNQIIYNNIPIEYEIVRKNVKNINIRIKPNSSIVVSCSEEVEIKTIELLILRRIKWILKRIEYFKMNSTVFVENKFDFVDGKSFVFGGFLFRFKIVESDKFFVKEDGNFLIVGKSKNKIDSLFNIWLNEKISQYFQLVLDGAYKIFNKYITKKPAILFKTMRTRWGTCNSQKNVVTLNKQMYKLPCYLSEYIIFHELTHLLFRNHNEEFYSFLTNVMPDWKKRNRIINSINVL